MGRRFILVTTALLLGTSAASAQPPLRQSPDSQYTDTLYATDQHMSFSIRNTMIRWLGGVSVSREKENKDAQKDGWWGDPVTQIPQEMVQNQPVSER